MSVLRDFPAGARVKVVGMGSNFEATILDQLPSGTYVEYVGTYDTHDCGTGPCHTRIEKATRKIKTVFSGATPAEAV